jgi:endoglucanase Acf2
MPLLSEGTRETGAAPRGVRVLTLLAVAAVMGVLFAAASRSFELRLSANETLTYTPWRWDLGTYGNHSGFQVLRHYYGPVSIERRYPDLIK